MTLLFWCQCFYTGSYTGISRAVELYCYSYAGKLSCIQKISKTLKPLQTKPYQVTLSCNFICSSLQLQGHSLHHDVAILCYPTGDVTGHKRLILEAFQWCGGIVTTPVPTARLGGIAVEKVTFPSILLNAKQSAYAGHLLNNFHQQVWKGWCPKALSLHQSPYGALLFLSNVSFSCDFSLRTTKTIVTNFRICLSAQMPRD